MKRRLVLFDIDGTLLLSMGAGRRALLAALTGVIPEPLAASRSVRFDGKTDPQIVRELLAAAGAPPPGEPLIEEVLDRYVTLLDVELARSGQHIQVLPGIRALLARVEQEHGAVLGLLTGNVARGARLKLQAGDLPPERFIIGAYGSDHADRTRLPAVAAARAETHFGRVPHGEEMVIVGDTPADVGCALAAGARAVGVATGSYAAADLRAAGADAVFDTVEALDQVWAAIWE